MALPDGFEEAVGEEDELDEVVFKVDNGKATKIIVFTGIQDSRYIEILSGLKDGEEVIVGPYDAVSKKLDVDKKVKIVAKKILDKLEDE